LYNIGDRIVHPLHGAGTIDGITSRIIDGTELEYYILKLPSNSMTLMVPVATSTQIGIRNVISRKRAEELLSLISSTEIEETANWNKRYRENAARIKSGEHLEVIRVMKSLIYRDRNHGLSTGERKMLHSAKQILLTELVLALDTTYPELEKKIDGIIADSLK